MNLLDSAVRRTGVPGALNLGLLLCVVCYPIGKGIYYVISHDFLNGMKYYF